MFDLSNRVALVTGAGQGVGAGIAEVLAESGATVYVNDLVEERARVVAERVGGQPAPFDVSDLDAVHAAVRAIGAVDILVNNAGIPATMKLKQFRDFDPAEWAPYIGVNLFGVLNTVRATIDGMCDRGWGRVITISSGAGTTGAPVGVSLYGAGKGGAISFTRHLAQECGPFGVTANTLALGLMGRDEAQAADPDRPASELPRSTPVGRLGTGRDVGYACNYLASNEAAWISGQTVGLNGGATTT